MAYSFPISADQICAAIRCPSQAIAFHWPLVEGCLQDMGIASENVCIAALATIAVETAHQFRPIDEFGGPEYWHKMYDIEGERPHVARELGNLTLGDGVKFHGRGLVQTTGRKNYEYGGKDDWRRSGQRSGQGQRAAQCRCATGRILLGPS